MAQIVVSERVIECRSDAKSLWGLLTDTDRTNRAIGMARLELAPLENATAARYLVSTSLDGFSVDADDPGPDSLGVSVTALTVDDVGGLSESAGMRWQAPMCTDSTAESSRFRTGTGTA